MSKATDPAFWNTKGIKYATRVGIGMDVMSFAFKQTKFQSDPTASGVPVMAANPEQGFSRGEPIGEPLHPRSECSVYVSRSAR